MFALNLTEKKGKLISYAVLLLSLPEGTTYKSSIAAKGNLLSIHSFTQTVFNNDALSGKVVYSPEVQCFYFFRKPEPVICLFRAMQHSIKFC